MAKDKMIYRKRCRWHRDSYAWVSDDGTMAVISDKNNKWNSTGIKTLKVRKDPSGYMVATHPYGFEVNIALAVIECFCPPKPKDGNRYMIGHKDGNRGNCHYKNLEWVPYHYQHATTNVVKLRYNMKTLVIAKDGSIKMDGKNATVYNSLYDSDMDLEAVISPHICIPRKDSIYPERVYIDDIMKYAGYVQGDDAGLKQPVILHRDEDWMNFSSDNLEFVEESDPRYVSYMDKRKKEMHNECIRQNPGKNVPDWY